MSLSIVATQLKTWSDSAALKATRANDPDSIAALKQAAGQFRSLLAAVQDAAVELDVCRRSLAAVPARKAPTVRRTCGINAFQFWAQHGKAVEAIIAAYGLSWKVRAPVGGSVLATVPTCWRSGKTERGGIVRWSKDHRMPAARFWVDGKLPEGLEITADYPRSSTPVAYGPPEIDRPHDSRWHREHGYSWDGKGWRFEIEIRNALNQSDAIEAERESKLLAESPMMMAAE